MSTYSAEKDNIARLALTIEKVHAEMLRTLAIEDDRGSIPPLLRAHFVRPLYRLWEKQGGLQGMTVEQFVRAAITGLD